MQYVEIVSVNGLSYMGAFHTTSKERLDGGLEQDYGCSIGELYSIIWAEISLASYPGCLVGKLLGTIL